MLIETLQKQSGLGRSQLLWLASTASKRYKLYYIPKRRGGHRLIEHPSRELKAIQRWINKYLFRRFPIHENATAYKKGACIRKNAEAHARTLFTLRLDFANFFPSFSVADIRRFLETRNVDLDLGLSEADMQFVSAIATRNGSLTIGSPSSPVVTNVMMYDFDNTISDLTMRNELVYTRYADDLFVSAKRPNAFAGIEAEINAVATNYQHVTLSINVQKTAYLSKRYRRTVTGLVITPDQKVSIGRDRKREIKSLIYHYSKGDLEGAEVSRLQGLVAFAMDAEVQFFQSLKDKYGAEVVARILRKSEEA